MQQFLPLARFTEVRRFLTNNRRVLGLALLILEGAAILAFYTPYWQTYDDVILAMLINGYGMAAEPSINLLYCNFVWAWLVQLLPDLFNVSNYTLALYACSSFAIALIWLALAVDSKLPLLKLLLVSSMTFYVFLNPQFTVTAMSCVIGGSAAFIVYQKDDKKLFLVCALLSCFLGFVIRDWTLPFIGLICMPFIRWRPLFANRRLLALLAVFPIAVASVYCINLEMKSGPQWREISAWNNERRALTDGHKGQVYAEQPDLLQANGYSVNDMHLLSSHFGLAANLINLPALKNIAAHGDRKLLLDHDFAMIEITFRYFFDWPLVLFFVIICVLMLRRYSLRTIAAISIIGAIFLLIGYFNRGGVWVSRIYYPSLYGLIIFLIFVPPERKLSKYLYVSEELARLAICVLLGLSILAFSKANLIETWEISHYDNKKAAELLNGAVWYGHPVRIEQLYAPFANIEKLKKIKFQCASWTTWLPNSRAYFDVRAKDGFDKYLGSGFNIAISQPHLGYLEVYCAQHLDGKLIKKELAPKIAPDFYRIRCEKNM